VTDQEVTPDVRVIAGRYRLGALLGHGGMADVYAGTDARLGRQVAVKLLKPSLANDPSFRTRFRQEAQAAARMAHPTIVRVFDAGEETVREPSGIEVQVPFIVMERVEGTLLKDLVARGPVPPVEAVKLVDGILTALEYSHRAGVVHRDIKPGNVMVTPSGQVKVMDFGIARAISDSSATIAQTSAILGTAQYFSPEQARGDAIDARTDLYSTGVVLYELLTGRPPFRGDTAVAVAYQHISEAPVPPNALNPAISPALNAVVMRALAKNKDERFQSASDFRADLDIAATGKVPDRVPAADDFNATLFGVSPNSTAASSATLRRLAEDGNDTAPRTQSRPPVAWIWGGIAVMAVIVVAALVWVFSLTPQNLVGAGAQALVPNVIGLEKGAAEKKLEKADLKVNEVMQSSDKVDTDHVISVTPEAGTKVVPGQQVEVVISTGPATVTLPGLIYKSQNDAQAAIKAVGLVVGEIRSQDSPSVAKGAVVGVQIDGIEGLQTTSVQVPKGKKVNLIVSTGTVDVPDQRGQSFTAARNLLSGPDYQLQVKLVADGSCAGGNVTAQSAIGEVPQKSAVTITYCSGG
jgi:serine/threonine-protein kinase